MTNTEILNEYFIWEENNSIEHQKNYENKNVSETNDTITNTKIDSTQIDWRSITDPKLRMKMRKKAYNLSNKERRRTYLKDNNEREKLRHKAWRDRNKDKIRNYFQKNKDKIRNYCNTHWKIDVQYKLRIILRSRLHSAINNNQKVGSAVKDLGCTIEQLKQHLESKFQPGMSWDNHTVDGWHIDHIIPLSSYDLTDRKQLLEACHYTNLQPLWAKDNLSKHNKIELATNLSVDSQPIQ